MYSDEEMVALRAEALARLVGDESNRKLVVAGPGTGKTYAFKSALSLVDQPALALTFLTGLVADLADDLGDLADVYSFHGFARRLLHTADVPGVTRDVDYYPSIDLIYAEDLGVLGSASTQRQIVQAFMNLDETSGVTAAVLASGSYYNAVGYTDSVYRVLRHLQADRSAVPTFSLVVVDEYQDFSLLETELIESLASASPILVAGDDDQALYGFRHASAIYLREMAADQRYGNFDLPFCSRCTEVMVRATHRVVGRAQEIGLLRDRLTKEYICFLPDKRQASDRYPSIRHVRCSVETNRAPYIGRFIASEISQLVPEDIAESRVGGFPTVLVIGPKQFASRVYEHLFSEFEDVKYKISTQPEVRLIDGYLRLMNDPASRLGWRILLSVLRPDGWAESVNGALSGGLELADLIERSFVEHHLSVAEVLNRLVVEDEASAEDLSAAVAATGLEFGELLEELGIGPTAPEEDSPEDPVDLSTVPQILVTSLLGAKGLQASHVYVVGLNEGHFPLANGDPSEDEVCQLLVALTRGRLSCTLVSTGRFGADWLQDSVFVEWLSPLLETVEVNRAYFEE